MVGEGFLLYFMGRAGLCELGRLSQTPFPCIRAKLFHNWLHFAVLYIIDSKQNTILEILKSAVNRLDVISMLQNCTDHLTFYQCAKCPPVDTFQIQNKK
ncbi:hypothetical protein XELAEV_18037067mg [Xenopus laevis]|uniref:Uncharacterized protein n=1 Tax=Xenopus laevis TaxID=8355 RepID=A0A974CCK9_XENLA|nr:hypothetical protein XELAEV_18037067mg [Xenopus laevis]